MTKHSSVFKKSSLGMAVGSALMALSLGAHAADFGLAGSSFSITPEGDAPFNAAVSNLAVVAPINGVPQLDLGVPTFGMTLNALNASDGSYSFQTYVMIDDNGSERRFEASLGTFTLTVSGGGTNVTGSFGAGQNITFYARNGAGTIEVNAASTSNVLQGVVNLSGGSITFDAQAALDELDDNASWQIIDDEFTSGDAAYTYAIVFKAPANARIGNNPGGTTFSAFPCATTAQLDSLFVSALSVTGPAYVVQGQFGTGAASANPANNPAPYGAACSEDPGGDTGGNGGGGGGSTPPMQEIDQVVVQVDSLLEGISLGDGVEISNAVLDNVNNAASAAAALGTQAANAIADGNLSTDTTIDVINVISGVVDVAGTASNATGNADPANTAAKGAASLQGLAKVLNALSASANGGTLTPVQKGAVQNAVAKAVTASIKLLAKAANTEVKSSVVDSLGEILSGVLGVGGTVSDAQLAAVREAAEMNESTGGVDDGLDSGVTIHAKADLKQSDEIADDLEDGGANGDHAGHIFDELSNNSTDPSKVIRDFGETYVERTISITHDLDSSATGVLYNPATGEFIFIPATFSGAPTLKSTTNLTVARAEVAREVPLRAASVNVVASTFPEGLRATANGSVVLSAEQFATVMVPASYDTVFFYADLARLGTVSTDRDGNVTIQRKAFPSNFHFTGTFDYRGTITGGAPVARTALTAPESGDESDLDYVYTVTYRDGTQQRIQPFVADDNFVASVHARGISVTTNRNKGVVTVNGRPFRPSYFVDPLNAAARAFWEERKDSFGIAYRPIDVNEDGVMDYQIITSNGLQVAYGISSQ